MVALAYNGFGLGEEADFEMESWITKNGGYALQKNKNRKRKEKRARKARPTNNKGSIVTGKQIGRAHV